MTRKLTCYAWGKPGDWEAICVDFDLATQGRSLEEVRSELQLALEDFLEYASELPENERDVVLRARTPWRLRVQLWLRDKCFAIPAVFHLSPKGSAVERSTFEVRLAP